MNIKMVLQTALLFVIVITLGTCFSMPSATINEPAISFESVSITGISFSSVDMRARIKIQNNNSFAIPFPQINWNLFVTDTSFLSGVIGNNPNIDARSSTTVELPFTVSYEGLYRTIASLLNADEAAYRIDLAIRFPMPILESKIFSTSFSGSIPMLKMPVLSFGGVKFNALSLSRVEFALTWTLNNRNAFAISLDKLDYNFAVNNVSWTSGSAPRLSIPARQTMQIPITVNINSLSMIQEIAVMAATGRAVNYTCIGEASLSPQIPGNIAAVSAALQSALSLPFSYSGTMNLRL